VKTLSAENQENENVVAEMESWWLLEMMEQHENEEY
jgi:hypothetical protein